MSHPVVAITGASGSCYAIRLIQALVTMGQEPYVVVSEKGKQVMAMEMGTASLKTLVGSAGFREEACRDLSSPLASGSFKTSSMVIAPCTMGTLGAVANGVSANLIHRAAEVTLKEGRKLILVPRETPFSQVALKNMLTLSQAGAHVVPANPGFYHNPKTVDDLVDFMAARILDLMGFENEISHRWTGMPVHHMVEEKEDVHHTA